MKSAADETFKLNNFDLIRLLAAAQVAVHHVTTHLELEEGWLAPLMKILPGVPIFFFVSGLLISKSYETNSKLREYTLNRVLRIYPALIVCTILSVLSVWATGYFSTVQFSAVHFVGWVVGQMTFFQFYPPQFMREFGSGLLNGSLWTVTVELQFYALVPILYWFLNRACKTLKAQNIALIVLIVAFLLVNVAFHPLDEQHGDHVAIKLTRASFIPWFYMFLIGVLVQKNFAFVHRMLGGTALIMLPAYLIVAYFSMEWIPGIGTGNRMNPGLYLLLAAMIFSVAYSAPKLANTLLRRNDISYGVYIYHIPVINLFMYYGYMHDVGAAAWVLVITAVVSMMSWFLIERPAMRLKKHPLFAVAGKS